MNPEQLKAYVAQKRKEKVSDNTIRTILLNTGYSRNDIAVAIDADLVPPPASTETPSVANAGVSPNAAPAAATASSAPVTSPASPNVPAGNSIQSTPDVRPNQVAAVSPANAQPSATSSAAPAHIPAPASRSVSYSESQTSGGGGGKNGSRLSS